MYIGRESSLPPLFGPGPTAANLSAAGIPSGSAPSFGPGSSVGVPSPQSGFLGAIQSFGDYIPNYLTDPQNIFSGNPFPDLGGSFQLPGFGGGQSIAGAIEDVATKVSTL